MTIYWLEYDGVEWAVLSETYDVFNYDAFCREMDELHEYWSFSRQDARTEALVLNK